MSIPIESVRTPRFTMEFFRFGRGKRPLVILPGISVQSVMAAAEAVAAAYQSLTEDFTIYVFDRRAQLPPVYPIEEMARDTAEAFRALGLGQVCLFGASQGGMIALVLAIEYPELVGKLVLGSSSAHVREEQYRVLAHWAELARRGDRTELYLSFAREIYPPEVFEQARDSLAEAAKTVTDAELARFLILAEGTRGFDVTDRLDRIRCPVLVIGSRRDAVLGGSASEQLAEGLRGSADCQLYMYDGYGHAVYDCAPDYTQRMLRFLTA